MKATQQFDWILKHDPTGSGPVVLPRVSLRPPRSTVNEMMLQTTAEHSTYTHMTDMLIQSTEPEDL
jgi:hypothetical protein